MSRITVFYCVHALPQGLPETAEVELQATRLPCSALVRDVFLLKAFEAGADGVLVVACPPGKCRRLDGNAHAAKRVAWTQALLDEIGLGGKRLAFADGAHYKTALASLLAELAKLGPNPVHSAAGAT